jgi:hypothetical protein
VAEPVEVGAVRGQRRDPRGEGVRDVHGIVGWSSLTRETSLVPDQGFKTLIEQLQVHWLAGSRAASSTATPTARRVAWLEEALANLRAVGQRAPR